MKTELFSGAFITLWKEVKIVVPINDEENQGERNNSLYGPRPYGYGPDNAKLMKVGEPNIVSIWIPVLEGITDREYKIIKYILVVKYKPNTKNNQYYVLHKLCIYKGSGHIEHINLTKQNRITKEYEKI